MTTAVSNLAGPGTPAMQVAVRRLDSRETTLVSGEYEPASGQTGNTPVSAGGRGAAYGDRRQVPDPGPGIQQVDRSAPAGRGDQRRRHHGRVDGGEHRPAGTHAAGRSAAVRIHRAAVAADRGARDADRAHHRRLGSGRPRVRGLGRGRAARPPVRERPLPGTVPDPSRGSGTGQSASAASSAQRGEAKTSPGEFVPRLSADGYTVAFLSRAEPIGLGEFFNQERERGEQADIYVADMHAGLTRDGALTTLTRIGGDERSGIRRDQRIRAVRRRPGCGVHHAPDRVPARVPGLRQRRRWPNRASTNCSTPTWATAPSPGSRTGYDGEPSEQPHQRKTQAKRRRLRRTAHRRSHLAVLRRRRHAAGVRLHRLEPRARTTATGRRPSAKSPGSTTAPTASWWRAKPRARSRPRSTSRPRRPGVDAEPVVDAGRHGAQPRDGSVALYVRVPGRGSLSASARSAIVVHPSGRQSRHAHRGKARKTSVAATVTTRTVAERPLQRRRGRRNCSRSCSARRRPTPAWRRGPAGCRPASRSPSRLPAIRR